MTLKFNVKGMTCAACSARVEAVTKAIDGVEDAKVNLLAGKMTVQCATDCTQDIIRAIDAAGYSASVPGKETVKKEETSEESKGILLRICVSLLFLIALMYLTMGHMLGIHGWQYET